MIMISERDLLRQFAEDGNEAAFAEVVRRYADLVYSVALRLTSGNLTLADDVAQLVFIDLARKAGRLSRHPALAGWLHTAARYNALRLIRGEQRRQMREQEAMLMPENISTPEPDWAQLRPWLDEAIGQLKQADAEAILLRFFQGRSHAEVGAALGLSEDSERKRVERALEKLRHYFSRKGVRASSALLAAAMTSNAVQAAPVGVAADWPRAALAAQRITSPQRWPKFLNYILIMQTKPQILFVAAAAIIVLGIVLFESYPKSGTAAARISAQSDKPLVMAPSVVEPPKVAPVQASNIPSPEGKYGYSLMIGGDYAETEDFSVSPAVLARMLGHPLTGDVDLGELKIRLIAAGVDFPPGAQLSYMAGKIFITDNPENLDRVQAFWKKSSQWRAEVTNDDGTGTGEIITVDDPNNLPPNTKLLPDSVVQEATTATTTNPDQSPMP
jgi:RNA polymerase sigma factor (sigma-70 family)